MSAEDRSTGIRAEPGPGLTVRQKLLRVLLAFALGAGMGLLAKWADGVPVVGAIGTELGVWVFAATVLAAWSRSPRAAALHVLAFFAAMLAAYYTYSMVLFGFFPRSYFFMWGGFALLSPIAAYVVWHARGDGWFAALCASLPVALLLTEGQAFVYTLSMPRGLALAAGIALYLLLPRHKSQWLRMLPLVAVLFLLISRLRIVPWLFGR